jgi:hypothetical protein
MKPRKSDLSRTSQDKDITVPRDQPTESEATSRKQRMPSPDDVNAPDEYLAQDADQPLPSDAPAGEALHKNPPPAKGELGVGSAGDAARPTKEGVSATTVPGRGNL